MVLVPTFQLHETAPDPSADLGPRPCAVEGPLLYSTVTVQLALAAVLAVTVAWQPRQTGEVIEVMWVEAGGGTGAGDSAAAGEGEMSRLGDGLEVGAASGLGLMAGELAIEAAADGDCPATAPLRKSGVATVAAAKSTRTSAASPATMT